MDRNALDWLFSTAPQAIAALVGLIVAGTSFIYGKIDDRMKSDTTFEDIGKKIKEGIYVNLKSLLFQSLLAVALDLFCLFLNPLENGNVLSLSGEFSLYFTVAIVVFGYNFWVLWQTVAFVRKTMKPSLVQDTVDDMSKVYANQAQEPEKWTNMNEFIPHFVELETLVRNDYFGNRRDDYGRPLPFSKMLWELRERGILSEEDYLQLREINKIRNLMLHEGNIQKVDSKKDKELQVITKKLKDRLKKFSSNS